MINWILKQIFYFRYFVLKQGKLPKFSGEYFAEDLFASYSFTDGQWNDTLPWGWKDCWNTYGKFKQCYGKWYFKAKMEPYIIRQPYFPDLWSAIWLVDMASKEDVLAGRADHPYYFEIDIELLKNDLSYTIHWNHTGKQDKSDPNYHVVSSKLRNRKLRRRLQKDYHLFLIDWSKKWIKFSINGILMAKFRNEIHVPMQMICSKISMSKVIVQKI